MGAVRQRFGRAMVAATMALAAATSGGCAAIHRPPTTLLALQAEDAPKTRTAHRATIDTLVDELARRAVIRGDHTVDLLFLSGGGQNGAYGVGFLRGWKSRTDAPMPRFDLVTGVSTGALQSPFAFLGTDERIAQGCAQYRNASDESAPTLDWLFWARKTGGLADVAKFEANIEKTLDPRMQAELLHEFDEHRRLVVTTTDLDLGTGKAWDLAPEMARADGRKRVTSLLVASSAIPSVFPPVVLDGHVHADGGIVSNVFVPFELADYRALAERLEGLGVKERVDVRIWVIVNGWMQPKLQVMDPASRGDLGDRSTETMFMAHQTEVLAHLEDVARVVSDEIPGLRASVKITSLPSVMANEPGASKVFDKEWMHRVEAFGYERGRGGSPWDELVSPFERPSQR